MLTDRLARAFAYSLIVMACSSSSKDEGATADGGGSGASGGSGGSGGTGASAGSAGAAGASGRGGSSGSGGAPDGSAAGSAGTVAEDAATDAPFDAASVDCATNPPAWPTFDRACWDDAWCSAAMHQVDCCGSVVATGILHPESMKFELAEAVCRSQQGICDCAPKPTRTDTGQVATDPAAIKVRCQSGVCTTYLP
jgi:hypothetical protein